MALVLKTTRDSAEHVDIAGVPRLHAGGRGGVPIEVAARAMSELQEKDGAGNLVLDENGNPKPLSGDDLRKAARAYAEASPHQIEVVNLNPKEIDALPLEVGVLPDRSPARDVSIASVHFSGRELGSYEIPAEGSGLEVPQPAPPGVEESS